jgi:hypothetical protein
VRFGMTTWTDVRATKQPRQRRVRPELLECGGPSSRTGAALRRNGTCTQRIKRNWLAGVSLVSLGEVRAALQKRWQSHRTPKVLGGSICARVGEGSSEERSLVGATTAPRSG